MAEKRTSRMQAGSIERPGSRRSGEIAEPENPSARGRWLTSDARRVWLGAALIAAAVGAAYANSLSAPFIFDDFPGVLENPSIRSLRPIWRPLLPLSGGASVVGRPIVNLSLAINYALGGTDVRGYHLFNLLVHLGAGLALFGIVRRTLGLARLPDWLRTSALPLGFATALLWVLHPLQTESVTFVIQRTESMGGFVYLLALYCFIRGTEPSAQAPRRWLALCIAACFIGVATKEIMVTAPLILLLYDRTFVAENFTEAWRKRRGFYGATALSWVLLAALMWQTQGRGGTVTFGRGVSVWTSLMTQCDAVAMYLKLALWPHPLVLDYGDYLANMVTHIADVLPQAALLTALAGATVYALIKRPALGFAGAWFFVILAPSSSVVPLLSQARAEHRMYLPLAAVVVLAVILIRRVAGRAAPIVFGALALALGGATAARNHDYRTALAVWTDTVQKKPDNPRAHYNVGLELSNLGDKAGAIREYEEALRLKPAYLDPHMNLAAILLRDGRVAEARVHAEAAIRVGAESSGANNNLGQVLFMAGDRAAAIRYFEEAVRLDPNNAEAHNNLGYALAARGSPTEAIEQFRRATALNPGFALAHLNLGEALFKIGKNAEARASLAEAVRLRPGDAKARFSLGNALAAAGLYAGALPHYQAAVRLNPADAAAHFNLGLTLRLLGRKPEAIESFQEVLRLTPDNSAAATILSELRGDR
jgi:tetratricopeptide (TPR) repeat protein